MLLQHQTGQRELTAAEAWHAACRQLNPYKKPHYENKLVSQAVHDIGYLNLCTAEHDMFSRFERVKKMSLRSKVLLPVSACIKVISQKSKPNEIIPVDAMRQRGLFFKACFIKFQVFLKSFIIYQFPKIYCSIKIEYGTPLVPVPNPLIKDTVIFLLFSLLPTPLLAFSMPYEQLFSAILLPLTA